MWVYVKNAICSLHIVPNSENTENRILLAAQITRDIINNGASARRSSDQTAFINNIRYSGPYARGPSSRSSIQMSYIYAGAGESLKKIN